MSGSATPPTPDGVPFLGNGIAFSRDPIRAMESWAAVGDIVRLTFPGRELYMVSDPDVIERILVTDQDTFSIGPAQREFFADVEDHAVTTNTGDRWRRLRRALHPAFTRERIRQYATDMARTTDEFVARWDDGDRFDLPRETRLLTVNVIGDALLDVDFRGRETVVTAAADALLARANFRRPGQFLPDWIPTPTDRRFARAVGDLDDFVGDVIKTRRKEAAGTREMDAEHGSDDVCQDLLMAHDRGALSLDEVRHNLVALLLAGHDSPATALTSALVLVSDNPAERAALVDEYEAVVDGPHPSADDVDELERTNRVVSETLRLYPPTTGVNRQATEPVSLGGYEFDAGAQFMLPQWVVHRDERFWEDPEQFDPSRWERDSDRPTFAYFPFSGGPRACVGNDFARQELVIALATTVSQVSLDVSVDGQLTFEPSIQLRPENDIEATVQRL